MIIFALTIITLFSGNALANDLPAQIEKAVLGGEIVSCTHMQVKSVYTPKIKVELPNTTAVKRAMELLSLINDGVKTKITNYLAENAQASLQDMADFFVMVHRDTLILSVQNVEKNDDPNSINMKLVSDITGLPMEFRVTVEQKAPHKITKVNLDFINDDAKEDKKISLHEATAEFNAFFTKVCQADMFSGAVLLAKNDKIIYQNACGQANKDFAVPNTVETKFNLGSMNKMFTAVAIAQLVEQGKLSFDDPLAKFLPNFPNKTSAKKITIRQLLSHTSGLGNYFNDKYNATPKDQLKTIDDFLALVKAQKPEFEPGTKWQYSNTGFLVLGKIIEIVTHKSYFDYIDEHIYAPAGMSQSGSFDLTGVNHNLAVGYNKEYTDHGYSFTNNLFRHVIKGGPAGGGYSTVGDLFKFSLALQHGKLIKQKTLEEMTAKQLLNERYGFGFGVNHGPLGKTFGHGGGFIGISSNLSIYPNLGYTMAILSNYSMATMPISVKLERLMQRIKD